MVSLFGPGLSPPEPYTLTTFMCFFRVKEPPPELDGVANVAGKIQEAHTLIENLRQALHQLGGLSGTQPRLQEESGGGDSPPLLLNTISERTVESDCSGPKTAKEATQRETVDRGCSPIVSPAPSAPLPARDEVIVIESPRPIQPSSVSESVSSSSELTSYEFESFREPQKRGLEVQKMPSVAIRRALVVQKTVNISIKPTGSVVNELGAGRSNVGFEEVRHGSSTRDSLEASSSSSLVESAATPPNRDLVVSEPKRSPWEIGFCADRSTQCSLVEEPRKEEVLEPRRCSTTESTSSSDTLSEAQPLDLPEKDLELGPSSTSSGYTARSYVIVPGEPSEAALERSVEISKSSNVSLKPESATKSYQSAVVDRESHLTSTTLSSVSEEEVAVAPAANTVLEQFNGRKSPLFGDCFTNQPLFNRPPEDSNPSSPLAALRDVQEPMEAAEKRPRPFYKRVLGRILESSSKRSEWAAKTGVEESISEGEIKCRSTASVGEVTSSRYLPRPMPRRVKNSHREHQKEKASSRVSQRSQYNDFVMSYIRAHQLDSPSESTSSWRRNI